MILSIESSCDDSSIAVTEINTCKVLFHKKISQEKEHSKYGGVVPELASRLHLIDLPFILEEAKAFFKYLKAVAVTTSPGLSITLLEGISMAKTISEINKIPLIEVNHLKGHIYSLFIEKEEKLPISVLLISGGHSQIIQTYSIDKMEIVANSIDDSLGESFDKVAKMMNLDYPGGPIIEKLAKNGNENKFKLPIPLLHSPLISFSFSGVKNAVRLTIQKLGGKEKLTEQDKCDISASFQRVVCLHLLQKTKKILINSAIADFAIVGGASSNLYIRNAFIKLSKNLNKNIFFPDIEYCSDNAVMIGRYAIEIYKRKRL